MTDTGVAQVRPYVDADIDEFPEAQRSGIGSVLLRAAHALSPAELRLYTFQRNAPARAFYAKHGFAEIAFGVSPAPESEPDVELRRPA